MSESPALFPDAEHPTRTKRPSRAFWLLLSVVIVLAAAVFAIPFFGEVKVRDGPRPDDGIRQMGTCLLTYADYNGGHLPPTLRAMIPEYLSEKNFDDFRYEWPTKSGRRDWLYFPWKNLDAIPSDTILLASPVTLPNTSGVQLRIVTKAAGDTYYIPEADFQRLIREQNPPAASPSPDR